MAQEGGDAAADQRRTLAIGGIAFAVVVMAGPARLPGAVRRCQPLYR